MAAVLDKLRAAQLSKHRLLLAAITRTAERRWPTECQTVLMPAYQELAEAERRDARAVADLIASPRFGGWAADCLRELETSPASLAHLRLLVAGDAEVPRLTAEAGGHRFEVLLDDRDPYLGGFGTTRAKITSRDLSRWREVFADAWTVLATRHQQWAEPLARIITTLVPIRPRATGRPAQSTAASRFGAVALSLAHDSLSMAETLVHEFHHTVLSAANDLTALTLPGADQPSYAPWRDDPRPAAALLQGVYAHFGVTGFWRREPGPHAQRQYARWRLVTARTADALTDMEALTTDGHTLLTAVRAVLHDWHNDVVPSHAFAYAHRVADEHRIAWLARSASSC
jgi:hypothetical protein